MEPIVSARRRVAVESPERQGRKTGSGRVLPQKMDVGMNASALRRTACWRNVTRVSVIRLYTIASVSLAALAPAAAQAPAWPTDAPKQAPAATPAGPTDNRAQGQTAPGAGGFISGPAAPSGFGPPRPMGPPPNQAALEACNQEFARMRADADKKSAVAKSVSEKKGTPAEFCKAITSLHSAMVNWWKYAKSQVSTCGVPNEVVKQLNEQHVQLAKVKTQVCNAASSGAGPARAPSLSEALGTTSQPSQSNTNVKRGGTLDTLTGNPIR
jgi:hypothetical protein